MGKADGHADAGDRQGCEPALPGPELCLPNPGGDAATDGFATRWLDAAEQVEWRSTIIGMAYLLRALDADLEAQSGLSIAEYELLVRLSEAGDSGVRMAELADQVAHSRSRVTHTVTRLERLGLVSRCRAVGDGRGVVAHLTATGRERLVAAAPGHVESVRTRLVDVITPAQLRALGAAMRTVLGAGGHAMGAPRPANPVRD